MMMVRSHRLRACYVLCGRPNSHPTPPCQRQALLAIIGLSLLSWALFAAVWIRLMALLTAAGFV